MTIYATIFEDTTERIAILSTDRIKGVQFGTQLPGGFADASFTMPSDSFVPGEWRDRLMSKFLLLTDAAGARIYEGTIEGVEDNADGLGVQAAGMYVHASLKTTYLAYPTAPVDLANVVKDGASLIKDWRSRLISTLESPWTGTIPLEFMFDAKVKDMIEQVLNDYPDDKKRRVQFAIYDRLCPYLFTSLKPWFKAARNDLTLQYGSSVSLTGTFNKIQVVYESGGQKRFTPWQEDLDSQKRYGVREGTLSVGDVPEGIAKVAGELAISRKAKPTEQATITIQGQVYDYTTGVPMDVYWLRAGHLLFVSDMEASPEYRVGYEYDKHQAGFLVTRTNYNHDNNSLGIEVGEGYKSLEQYLADIGVSGGDVQ